jgi:uncharacterized protein YcaQ
MALHGQLLDGRVRLPRGREGVARAIEHLGYVQIDTISVIERAHHHTLWTRRPDYEPATLHQLHARDRRIFEYLGHAASFLPMKDYRFYIPAMRASREPRSAWHRKWLDSCGHLLGPVLERIRQEGPLTARDFKPPPGTKRGTWWDWKPAKAALELLFWRGDLMVSERRGFERVYDLTERVLPAGTDTRPPEPDELGRFLVRRALTCLGAARKKEIRDHIRAGDREVISRALAALVEQGEVVRVEIEGEPGRGDLYASAAALKKARRFRETRPRVSLLSPFDNLVIARDWLGWLFGFDYKIECYVPAKKRKHGYFVLPVLWGERFVGRLDPKTDRRAKALILQNLIFEAGVRSFDALLPPLSEKIVELARFNGCEEVRVERASPSRCLQPLRRLIRRAL